MKNLVFGKLKNNWLQYFSSFATFFLIITFFSVVIFIFHSSWPILSTKGLSFLFEYDWNPGNQKFGLLTFIISTFWTVILSMFLVIFLTIFVGIFISKFLPLKIKAVVMFFINLLSGVPSVCFGMFGAFIIVPLFHNLGAENPQSMLTAILVLTLMVLPTTLVLTINLFDNVSENYEFAAYALGLSKITVAFKIVKTLTKKGVWIVLFFGFCKVIGEVTAVTLIAGNSARFPPLNQGFTAFFFTSITTLSSLIGLEIGENFGPLHSASLFTSSLVLILIVLLVDIFLMLFLNFKLPSFLKLNQSFPFFFEQKKLFLTKIQWHKFVYYWTIFSDMIKYFLMLLTFFVISGIYIWILGDIVGKGIAYFQFRHLIASAGENALLVVFIVTIMLVLITIILSSPFAFLVAIFLVFYGKTNFFSKKITKFINYFIYQFSSIPTVIFGMFGLILFVGFFDLGFSVIAGAFTMSLIVLPVTIRIIQQNLENFPKTQYYSAIALGLRKEKIILKLILPTTIYALLISFIFIINKIISESSPILLTMGSAIVFPERGALSEGRTFATHIYLIQSESLTQSPEQIVYQTAFITLFLLLIFNITVYWLQKKQQYNKNSDE